MEILNERPDGMPFEQYKEALRNQKRMIKNIKKGIPIYISKSKPFIGSFKQLLKPTT